MKAVARTVSLHRLEFTEILLRQRVVQRATYASDRKREDEALDVKTSALSEFEEARRVPISGHIDRFS